MIIDKFGFELLSVLTDIVYMKSFLNKFRVEDKESGFSLPELMITVLIIGILTAIAIPVYNEQKKTAIRAQVDTDLASTAQSLSTWQQSQEEYLATPTTAVFDSKIARKSNTATTMALKVSTNHTTNEEKQFCIEAAQTISGEVYRVHYQVSKKMKGTGTCPAFVMQTAENYG